MSQETSWAQSSVPLSSMRSTSDAYAAYMEREWQLRRCVGNLRFLVQSCSLTRCGR